jgi:16S rRNA (cytosine1402-N4)-methyltransferase
MDYSYHRPVMLTECLDGLDIKPDGVYVDVTFGGGGHAKAILEKLTDGHLYAFDQDPDAEAQSEKIESQNFTFIASNFRNIKQHLRVQGVKQVDGILADLGISSYQIDTPDRGFSTRFDQAEIDMRMDPKHQTSAAEILNTYSFEDLHKIMGIYGELKNAKSVAGNIVQHRSIKEFQYLTELKAALAPLAPRGKENKFYAQVYQALRIEVNREIEVLQDFLLQTPEILKKGGRLVIMSYHSLEDRPVKNFIKTGKFYGEVEKDLYGNEIKPLNSVSRKPIEASEDELVLNPRARSAKLRIAEKI